MRIQTQRGTHSCKWCVLSHSTVRMDIRTTIISSIYILSWTIKSSFELLVSTLNYWQPCKLVVTIALCIHEYLYNTKVLLILFINAIVTRAAFLVTVFPWILPTSTTNFRPHLPVGTIRGREQIKSGVYFTAAHQPCMHATLYYCMHVRLRGIQTQDNCRMKLMNKLNTEC